MIESMEQRYLKVAGTMILLAALIGATANRAHADAFDDQVNKLANLKTSFGHDVDAEDKVSDFVKAGLGAFEIPHGGADRLKKIMVNGYDYWNAARANQKAGQDPQLSDFNKFFIKSMLDSVSPKELVRVKKMLGNNAVAAKAINEAGIDVTEALSGTLPDGSARDVVEAAAVAAIDALCPQCAVVRTAAVIAINEGDKLRVVFENDRTRALYEAWKQGNSSELPQGLRGGDAAYLAARRAVMEARQAAGQSGKLSNDELDAIIIAKFESWRRGEAVGKVRSEVLAKSKPTFEGLDASQRRLFGADEKEQAQGFASGFIDAYEDLKKLAGGRPLPSNIIQDAVFIAVSKADPNVSTADWRNRLRQVARNNGWPDPFPSDPTGTRQRVSARLKKLNHYKMQAVFDAIGVPNAVRTNFYGCLCSQVPHGVGVSYIYAPENGKPCAMAGGFGVDHQAFPTLETAYDICFDTVSVAPSTGAAPVPFDDYVAGQIRGRK